MIALVLAGGACGGSENTTTTGRTDRQQVIEVVKGTLAAEADGNGEELCDYLTPSRQQELIQLVGEQAHRDFPSCAAAVGSAGRPIDSKAMKAATVVEVTINGDSAQAQATARYASGSHTTSFTLVRTSGGWKIGSAESESSTTTVVAPSRGSG